MPRLRSLKLSSDGPSADWVTPLWAAPWFSQLQELSMTEDQGVSLAPLRAAPLLRKLCMHQSYGTPGLTAADGRALAAASLPELRELRLHVEPGLVAALAAAPWLGRLEWLYMTGWDGLAADDGRALAAAPLRSLRRLCVDGFEPGFMAACASAPWLGRLESLELRSVADPLVDGGGPPSRPSRWAAAPFTALASLTLCRGSVPPPYVASRLVALVAAPWFGRLQDLTVRNFLLGSAGSCDGAGLRALAAAPLPSLTSLSLSGACLSVADLSRVLSSAPWLAALTSLKLVGNHLGVPGHRALSRLRLPRLRALSLHWSDVDCAGLAALVSAPWLTQLTKLRLAEIFSGSAHCCEIAAAIEDEEWEFGRLRRLGCVVDADLIGPDEPSDDETGSDGDPGDG
jgi:hypothetical protein